METEEQLPAVIQTRPSDLYRALKLASEVSGRVGYSFWRLEDLKTVTPSEIDTYKLDEIFKDLLFAEAHLEMTRQAFSLAKREVAKAQGSKLMEEFA